MRKLGISALVAASFFLTACGGDDEPTTDETTSSEETAGGEETPADEAADEAADDAAEGEDSAGAADLNAAVLAAEDLPEGVEITPIDVAGLSNAMAGAAGMIEGMTFEPADCQDNSADPLQAEGVEAAAITATSGDMESGSFDVLMNAVYSNADTSSIAAVEDYYAQCAEVAVSGEVGGTTVDMTISTQLVDAPELDADEVIAIENTTTMQGLPATTTRLIYLIDGDHGVYLAGNPESTVFDLDALAGAALDKLRAAQG